MARESHLTLRSQVRIPHTDDPGDTYTGDPPSVGNIVVGIELTTCGEVMARCPRRREQTTDQSRDREPVKGQSVSRWVSEDWIQSPAGAAAHQRVKSVDQ